MDTDNKKESAPIAAVTAAPLAAVAAASSTARPAAPAGDRRGASRGRRGPGGPGGGAGGGRGGPRRGNREPRSKPEFDQKILDIRRVARVAAGGRRFNFSVTVVIGDRKGSVGVGTGKAGDTSLAIDKAVRSARKNMLRLSLTKSFSISHEVRAKYSSARIMILPAAGRGLVAGSAVRNVLELAGVKDVTAKIISPSKNKLNIARAAIQALSQIVAKRPTQS